MVLRRAAAACCLLTCLLLLPSSLAWGVEIVETYRSPHGLPMYMTVDPRDSSCWISAGSLVHLDAEGNIVQSFPAYGGAWQVSLNTSDGSLWLINYDDGHLIHVDRNGQEQFRGGGYDCISSVSVNSGDGSVWLATYRTDSVYYTVRHLDAYGQEIDHLTGLFLTSDVFVNPQDGSVWFGTTDDQGTLHRLGHYRANLTALHGWDSLGLPLAISPTDGSVWAFNAPTLTHVSAQDEVLGSSSAYPNGDYPLVNPADGTCWYRGFQSDQNVVCTLPVVHFDVNGTQIGATSTEGAWAMAVDPNDGSLWAASGPGWSHFASNGDLLLEDRGLARPDEVTIGPGGDYWLTGLGECYGSHKGIWVAHYDALGNETGRLDGVNYGRPALDPTDGSVWMADHRKITHVAADGTEVPFSTTYGTSGPNSVDVAPDGSLWVCDTHCIEYLTPSGTPIATTTLPGFVYDARLSPDGSVWAMEIRDTEPSGSNLYLVHLLADGTWCEVSAILGLWSFSVDMNDGSVWACDTNQPGNVPPGFAPSRATHLSPSEDVLWQGGSSYNASFVQVDQGTGNCWVIGNTNAVLTPAGEELGQFSAANYWTFATAVSPVDGSLWLVGESCQLSKLSYRTPFPDVAASSWAAPAIDECVAADVVHGYWDGSYEPAVEVTRAQMAAFIARSLANGDASVPPGPHTPTFPDVPADSWAYNCVEYAVVQCIVAGYPDGLYHPDEPVDRGQMAAFIARAMAPLAERPDLLGYMPPAEPSFADIPTDHWAFREVEYVRKYYVVNGYPDGLFHPEQVCDREQMAVFVARAFHLFR